MPLTAIPARTPHRSEVTPTRPLDATTAGRASRGTCSRSHSSSSHASRRMSKSIVRLALVASVAWTSPPVRFQITQLSTVPRARSSPTGTPPSRSIHSHFVPLK